MTTIGRVVIELASCINDSVDFSIASAMSLAKTPFVLDGENRVASLSMNGFVVVVLIDDSAPEEAAT